MTTLHFKRDALKKKINPVVSQGAKLRKAVGDKAFPVIADKMIEGIKGNRESRANDKSMGY